MVEQLQKFLDELKNNSMQELQYSGYSELIWLLASKHYVVKEIIDIIFLSGLHPARINLQGSAINIWSDTVRHAKAVGKLDKLIEAAIKYQTKTNTQTL